ncbi:MAG: GTP-binding protein, partial [Euryarchaeota archaeon]|nr:GTP-binding protein [Euryarchaeota archaeon]
MKTKVCLVGEHGVGKTSLIRRYVLDEFDDRYIVTLGAKVSKKELSF